MHKKAYLACALTVAFIPTLFSSPAVAAIAPQSSVTVESVVKTTDYETKFITASLNLRVAPDTTAEKAGMVIPRLSLAYATGEVEGKWTQIVYKGVTGWIESRFVQDYDGSETPAPPEVEAPAEKPGPRFITASLNLLVAPDFTSDKTGMVIPRLNVAHFTGETSGKFSKIIYKNVAGWIETRFVQDYDGVEKPPTEVIHPVKPADPPKPPVTETPSSYKGDAYITASVHVRKTSDPTSENLSTITRMTKMYAEGEVSGKYSKITYLNVTGWVETRFVKELTGNEEGIREDFHGKPSKELSDKFMAWVPDSCKNTEIRTMTVKNGTAKLTSFGASTRIDPDGTPYFEIRSTGHLDPSGPIAEAIMKHECGHVLATIYDQNEGRANWIKFLDRGWSADSPVSRVEYISDCISDELGATRKGAGYTVGYGGTCNTTQKQLAKELIKYGETHSIVVKS